MKRVIRLGTSIVVLSIGAALGFSGLLFENAKMALMYSIWKSAADENQRINDSLASLYKVPKAHADTPHEDASCGCSGGCCGCDGGCSGCCG